MSSSTRVAELLSIVVRDTDQREAIVGDLREEFARYSARVGPLRAARWHLRQSLGIAMRYGFTRLLRRKPPVRWITTADLEPQGPWWTGAARDLRYAWRATQQRPMLSGAFMLTLALALAANSTTFSLLDALVLRPYRFAGVDRLIVATTTAPDDTFFDRLDGAPYEVVGVAAPGFNTPDGAEVWSPIAMTDEQWANRRAENYGIMGRLAEGVALAQAHAELTAIVDTQRRDHADTNHRRYARVLSFTKGLADPGAGSFISVWQAAALLLLLIACANIANLLMARGAERASEYSIRLALGSSRTRLFGQTLMEGLVLSIGAVVLAMPLIAVGLALSRASIPVSVLRFVPGWAFIRLDVGLFLATAALGTVAMLIFSLLPAIQATKAQVADTLRQSGRSLTPGRNRQWARSALATTQMALALALVFASSLAMTAAYQTVNGRLGFDKDSVLVAQLNLPERNYADPERRRRFITGVTDAMRVIPAASHVGVVSIMPAAFNNWSRRFSPEGENVTEQEARTAQFRMATPEYFAAMKIPLMRGRLFDESDRRDSTPVAILSTTLARRYWGDDDPLGKRFRLAVDGPWITVIGVSGDIVHNWFDRRLDMFYVPISQQAPYSVAFAVRTVGDPHALAGDLRRAVAAVDADQPIAALDSLDSMVEERAAGFVFIARALGIVGLIALVLSIIGIYSLMAFVTAQRTREIGVRMALGAGRWQVVRATTTRAVAITFVGSAIGSALAIGAGRLMESLLYGLVSTSLAQLAALVAVLGFVALLAAYVPARRAARVDPMSALRQP